MGMGLISESVFGDIANAIREQNGTATAYKPSEMAVAVAALDGTNAGNATTVTSGTATGVIGESVFSDIADAIRGQNGLETTYKSGEMAQAIRDLVWDVGLKLRALLLSDETLEHAFSSCTAVTELDLTGFDPSSLTDLFYAFAGCSALTTIYVDADWALPSGCTGNQCFYSCKSLVGGNGTARASGKTGIAYCVVDKDGQAGYLTAKA